MTDHDAPGRATSVGATGGLPGANADPRTAELDAADLASSVAREETDTGDVQRDEADPADVDPADVDPADVGRRLSSPDLSDALADELLDE